VITQPVN